MDISVRFHGMLFFAGSLLLSFALDALGLRLWAALSTATYLRLRLLAQLQSSFAACDACEWGSGGHRALLLGNRYVIRQLRRSYDIIFNAKMQDLLHLKVSTYL